MYEDLKIELASPVIVSRESTGKHRKWARGWRLVQRWWFPDCTPNLPRLYGCQVLTCTPHPRH